MGVQIVCDDFGTGYSSFRYLQNLAFDRIKIDRSFVQELEVNPSALRIIQAMLTMAQSLGIRVTAEGVETERQFSLLHERGCSEIQGFLLGRPVPGEGVGQWLHKETRSVAACVAAEATAFRGERADATTLAGNDTAAELTR
jgi:EAL domain-containing protein (putative c-di-GMP-specific phosphodiesterase class I)